MHTNIRFIGNASFKNAVLITGLPGIGLVGKIAVDYLIKRSKVRKIAEITSDTFPPSLQTKGGLIELIKDELYHIDVKGRDYLLLAGPVQPPLDLGQGLAPEHHEFAKAVVNALIPKGVKEVYTLAGINVGEKRISKEPRVVIAATDRKILERWKKLGAVADKPDGLITGAAGLILAYASEAGIGGACLMGETNTRLIYGDHGAAKKLLELLTKAFGFRVDMGSMEKDAKEIECAFKELSKRLIEEDVCTAEPSGLSYVR